MNNGEEEFLVNQSVQHEHDLRALFLPPTNADAGDELVFKKHKIKRDLVYVPCPLLKSQDSKKKKSMINSNTHLTAKCSVLASRLSEMKKEKNAQKRQRDNRERLEEKQRHNWIVEAIEMSLESKFSKLRTEVKSIIRHNVSKNVTARADSVLRRLADVNDHILILADDGQTPRPLSNRISANSYSTSARSAPSRPAPSLYPSRPLAPRPSTQLLSRRGVGGLGVGPISLVMTSSPHSSPMNRISGGGKSKAVVDVVALTDSRICVAKREVKLRGKTLDNNIARDRKHRGGQSGRMTKSEHGYDREEIDVSDNEEANHSGIEVDALEATKVLSVSRSTFNEYVNNVTESSSTHHDCLLDGDANDNDDQGMIARMRFNYAEAYAARTISAAIHREAYHSIVV